jgi:hypothetical protein
MTETTPDARYIATQTKRYEDKLQAIADDLHEIGRRIAREGKPHRDVINDDGQDDYMLAAERALHALSWGLANLNADRLVSAAADAHSAVRGRFK